MRIHQLREVIIIYVFQHVLNISWRWRKEEMKAQVCMHLLGEKVGAKGRVWVRAV